jgi:hypothetical protein
MKNRIILITFILYFNTGSIMQAFAQIFVPPALTEVSYNVGPIQPRNTGSDILELGGGDIYRVSVWEPTVNGDGFGWLVDYGGNTYTGTLPFQNLSSMGDPDVCLVHSVDLGQVLAFIVYYDQSSSTWYVESYYWDTSSLTFVIAYTPYALDVGGVGTTINIDGTATPDGKFVVVWDDASNATYATVGDANSYIIANKIFIRDGTSPDLSIYVDALGNYNVVHIALLNSGVDLTVLDFDFADLAVSNTSNVVTALAAQSPPNGGVFRYPRIASPTDINNAPNEWTVVAEEYVASGPQHYIVAYNNGNTTPLYYNDGVGGNPLLIDDANYFPVVCYDRNYPANGAGIWVGWNFACDKSNFAYSNIINNAEYGIIMNCDLNAIPLTADCWILPDNITPNNGDLAGFISMAGRYASDRIFITFAKHVVNGSMVEDVFYKDVANVSAATSMRIAPTDPSEHNSISSEMEDLCVNTDDLLQVEIRSVDARLLHRGSLTCQQWTGFMQQWQQQQAEGLYLYKVISAASGKSYQGKITRVN